MKTIRLTTAQAVVAFLKNQYLHVDEQEHVFVQGVFNIFGHGNVLSMGQALAHDPGHLQVIQGKNEQGMTHAAIAYAKQSNRQKIFAVTASAGPGSANMVTAAATAFANNIPVLLLPADTFASRQPGPTLQQLEHEQSAELSTNDAFRAVSRYWDRITRPEQLMSALLQGFSVLTNPATAGPVTLCIAQDVSGEAFNYPIAFFDKRVHYLDRKLPTPREVTAAVQAIRGSQRPVIIVGGGARYAGAGQVLCDFAQQFGIPMVETQAGKSTVSHHCVYNLGGVGITGTGVANRLTAQADLIIGVGTRYTDFTTSSKTLFAPEARFLNLNVNPVQTLKLEGMGVVADAKVALEQIQAQLGDYHSAHELSCTALRAEWDRERSRLRAHQFSTQDYQAEVQGQFDQATFDTYVQALGSELSQAAAVVAINDWVAQDSCVITAAGSLPGDLQRLWQSHVPHTYHAEYGYSCMGYEISGALGVKLANPDQEVYSFVGDGSFLMLHSELITALQYSHKINVLLFDNAGFGCINNLQMANGHDSYCCEFRTATGDVMVIDYATVARGYGAITYTVRTLDELKQALADSQQQTVSTLIDIKVLPKTMTNGYEGGWWNVGLPQVTHNPAQAQARLAREQQLQTAKQY